MINQYEPQQPLQYVSAVEVADIGWIVVKHDDVQQQRHYVGRPTSRTAAYRNAIHLASRLNWRLVVQH